MPISFGRLLNKGGHMRSKLVRGLVFGTALSIWTASLWQIVQAQSSTQNLKIAPFIASDRKETPDFIANVASTGKRSPFFLRTNKENAASGTYNGLLINSESKDESVTLNTLSMDLKGDVGASALVRYCLIPTRTRGAMHFETVAANLNSGSRAGLSKDGYQKISFTNQQLGIPENNLISNIVIAQPPGKKSGKLLVDDVKVNMAPVRKAMETLFFEVENGSPTGPAGALLSAEEKQTKAAPGPTSLTITNGTSSQITVWATLPTVCTGSSNCILSVTDIFPNMTCVSGGCFQGSQTLAGNSSISYTPVGSPAAIEGLLVSFNAAPNCAVTVAEATLNNDSQSIPNFKAQETTDVSIVNGNNASIQITLDRGKGAKWATNYGYLAYKKPFQNYSGPNLNFLGVFPFLCTNCTASISPPPCGTLTDGCNTPCVSTGKAYKNCPQICTYQRDANKTGGTVTMTYLGAPQPPPNILR